MSREPIVLDVGGTLFKTSRTTLLSAVGSCFDNISSGAWRPESDGTYFLDADPTYFGRVLNHLRCEASLHAGLQPWEVTEVDRLRTSLGLDSAGATPTPTWDHPTCGAGLRVSAMQISTHGDRTSMGFARTSRPFDQFCVRLTARGGGSDVALGFGAIYPFGLGRIAIQYCMFATCIDVLRINRRKTTPLGISHDVTIPDKDIFPPDVDLLVTWHRQSHTLTITCEAAAVNFSKAFPHGYGYALYPVVGLLPGSSSFAGCIYEHSMVWPHQKSLDIQARLVPMLASLP
ncbi:hypothetical protein SPRG_09326 [Saprolegnia parasitica CBS 223.65]|uniref:Potassium channel tetramerisation-type BTB domain-containing protein n=1 Tax=Saprolegnia parasitica (strain CBS 223.65) TaxID=695850 RepID=A0A067C884_SAPPC|nr:hypothetical protein SPRG_09326 [Saprolegnia parasitica CBS 223.65]KDO25385.1 hypothetical protein SPRG_09326 [Saprolegnia parasitica CBS 223.65]|eukprot:XP_012203813.1 hypothetical protein SPRG_09326 [Saprolegnia parasitica CBS 223.65]